jgi:XisH protein
MAKDLLHESVRKALEKDGWTIKDDPFYLYDKTLGIDYEVDLGAEKVVIAQKELQKIVVEVKSFARLSLRNEFHGIFRAIRDLCFSISGFRMGTKIIFGNSFDGLHAASSRTFFVTVDGAQ